MVCSKEDLYERKRRSGGRERQLLEQIVHATLLVSAIPIKTPDSAWIAAMEHLSAASLRAYRELVEHPGFLHYFDCATPISEIETLPIVSRPARRAISSALRVNTFTVPQPTVPNPRIPIFTGPNVCLRPLSVFKLRSPLLSCIQRCTTIFQQLLF